ncbi:MAG: chromosomal replication initiator protein DnaA [Phascolarctobacterium sp.]|nr:chromosomal replication initiator protein DnaA [Phascolarctobacterium sp.]
MKEQINKLWQNLQELYSTQYSHESCNQLLRNSKAVSLNDNQLTVVVANQLMRKALQNKASVIETLLSQLTNEKITLDIIALETDPDKEIPQEEFNSEPSVPDNFQNEFESHLDPKFTFKNFVVGNNTRFTFAAAQKVVEKPGNTYSPLFIYGNPGLGKTHLIQAIGNAIHEKNPAAKILYITTEGFTNDLINSIKSKTTNDFHNKYRKLDCLIIDDIQQLEGKERTQEEFFNTFNTLDQDHKQIIVASDRLPQNIKTLQDRIASRLSRGFLGDIQSPDFETRLAILRLKTEERGFSLDDECMSLIANSITTDIRIIESLCNKLALRKEIGEKITQAVIFKEINKLGEAVKVGEINIERIITVICDYYGITQEEVFSNKRSAKISEPRQIIMYLARTMTNLSFKEIGQELGGRDHSTVMHGFEKIYAQIQKNDKKLITTVDLLKNKLK